MLGFRVSRVVSLCALAAWFSAVPVSSQPVPLGPDFPINQFTTGNQANAAVAVDGNGNFVVVWDSYQDGDDKGVFARLFDQNGAALGDEFQVNTYTTDYQALPRVARRAAGDFVVVWQSQFQDTYGYGIYAQRFDGAGAPQGGEFRINAATSSSETRPWVALQSDGSFVVVWQALDAPGSVGIFGRRFDASGVAQTGDFQVNTFTTNHQQLPRVFVDPGDGFVVAWISDGQDGSSNGAFARRYNSSATAITGEFRLNAFTTGSQASPSLAFDPTGGFVATWASVNPSGPDQDGDEAGIFGRRFDSSSQPFGDEFQVNALTTDGQVGSTVLPGGSGSFVVVWQNYLSGVENDDIYTRSFNGLAQPRGGDLRVNGNPAGEHRQPHAAGNASRYLVVWQSTTADGSNFGVLGRLFQSLVLLDVDGNGEVDPLTDGLLFIRYIFGFRNQELIQDAVGPGCTRCDAMTIEMFLGAI